MLVGNRLVRILFTSLFVIILALNLFSWLAPRMALANANYDVELAEDLHQNYHGFNWFFNQVSTFPGLQPMIDTFLTWGKLGMSGNVALDSLLNILKVIALPFVALWSVLVSLWTNLIWILGFLGIAIS